MPTLIRFPDEIRKRASFSLGSLKEFTGAIRKKWEYSMDCVGISRDSRCARRYPASSESFDDQDIPRCQAQSANQSRHLPKIHATDLQLIQPLHAVNYNLKASTSMKTMVVVPYRSRETRPTGDVVTLQGRIGSKPSARSLCTG